MRTCPPDIPDLSDDPGRSIGFTLRFKLSVWFALATGFAAMLLAAAMGVK